MGSKVQRKLIELTLLPPSMSKELQRTKNKSFFEPHLSNKDESAALASIWR